MRDLWFYLLQGDEKYVDLIYFKCFLAVLCENKMILSTFNKLNLINELFLDFFRYTLMVTHNL